MSFQSSLFYWLRETGYGVVDWNELDQLEATFSISGVKSSKLKRVRDWIENEEAKHGLSVSIAAHPTQMLHEVP